MRIGCGLARGLQILAFLVAGAAIASATTCGTVASQLSCAVTVGGSTTYNLTGFTFVNSVGVYQGGDVDIDLIGSGNPGAGGITLTFSKHPNSPTGGTVFFANSGEFKSFFLIYDVSISPAAAGTVAFVNPMTDSLDGSSHGLDGNATEQLAITGAPLCQATTATPSVICSLPANPGTTLFVSDIVQLQGNTGNASILGFAHGFNSTFTAASAVPEPSSVALLGIGFCLVGARRVVVLRPRQRLMKQR